MKVNNVYSSIVFVLSVSAVEHGYMSALLKSTLGHSNESYGKKQYQSLQSASD